MANRGFRDNAGNFHYDSDYKADREWSDQFIPEIKEIVGPLMLMAANLEEDRTEATDLIVFKARDQRIAARIRRPVYKEDYLWHFTLRSKAAAAAKAELQKIAEGWGDLLFYGHASADAYHPTINRWFLIDLAAWRAQMIFDSIREMRVLVHGNKTNQDKTEFRWFDLRSFTADPPILRAGSHGLPSMT